MVESGSFRQEVSPDRLLRQLDFAAARNHLLRKIKNRVRKPAEAISNSILLAAFAVIILGRLRQAILDGDPSSHAGRVVICAWRASLVGSLALVTLATADRVVASAYSDRAARKLEGTVRMNGNRSLALGVPLLGQVVALIERIDVGAITSL
jgi:hypothetical protein